MFIELYRAVLIYEIRRNVTIPNFIAWNSFMAAPQPQRAGARYAYAFYYKRRSAFWQGRKKPGPRAGVGRGGVVCL